MKLFPECDGYPARLKNVAVRLTKERCRDVQDGGETWGLRISMIPASELKKKVITEDKVQTIIDWAQKNRFGIKEVSDKYDFESDAVKQAIIDQIEDLPA